MNRRILASFALALCSGAALAAETQTIALQAGWNLIAPQVEVANPDPAVVFGPLGASYLGSWQYDAGGAAWKTHQPAGSADADVAAFIPLTEVRAGKAYWVFLSSPGQLSLTGELPAVSQQSFVSGWNMVGFPGNATGEDVNIGAVLAAAGAQYDVILKWESGIYKKFTPRADDTDQFTLFSPSSGYWVRAQNAFSLQPAVLSSVRADVDADPKNNFPSYEDLDIKGADPEVAARKGGTRAPLGPGEQDVIAFLPGEDTQLLSLSNSGGGIVVWDLQWEPDGNVPNWLGWSAARGVTTIESDVVELRLNRTSLVKGTYTGTLTLRTNTGNRVFRVVAQVPGIDGEWRGSADIATVSGKRNPVPTIDLHFHLYQDEAIPGMMRGFMDSTNALLWPVDVPLVGNLLSNDSNSFLLTGSYAMAPGDQNNPSYTQFPGTNDVNWGCDTTLDAKNPYPFPIQRTVTLVGSLVAGSSEGYRIEGSYVETVDGLLRESIQVEGSFVADRVSAKPYAGRRVTANASEGFGTGPVVLKGESPTATISAGATLERPFTVTTDLVIQDMSVTMDVVGSAANPPKPFPHDLVVSLQGPGGQVLVLHDGIQFPITSLQSVDFPGTRAPKDSFTALAGTRAKGTWKLIVRNTGSQAGLLNRWQLRLQGQPLFELHGKVEDAASGSGLPAIVSLAGLPYSESVEAAADGTFRFDGVPGVPVNISATLPGYEPANPARPGIQGTAPRFADCAATTETNEATLSAAFRPLPGFPVPAAANAGYAANLGTAANPLIVSLRRNVATEPGAAVLLASPLVAPAPAEVSFSLIASADTIPASTTVAWNFGDGATASGVGLRNTHRYTTPGVYTATATAGAITRQVLVQVHPSPGNSTQAFNFFQVAFTAGGTASREELASPGTKPLLKVQHADCANFDIDRAPKTTAGNRAFDGDGVSSAEGQPSDNLGGFKGEDTDYFTAMESAVGLCDQLLVQNASFVPYPIGGASDDDCSKPRYRMVCNLLPQIIPASHDVVIPAPMGNGYVAPAPPPSPNNDGIAKAPGLRLVAGPLSGY